tara:strand:- start:9915 stop:11807 length:1893 start_codon:yes stop_codon:yes gene_type:complete
MSIFDRNMFRQTSAVSPDVTVIGESGGGVRPQINMPPPSAEIGIGSFERPEFEVNPIIDNVVTNTPEVITDSGLGENQIRLSTGEIITVDPSNLSNIVNSDALFTLDVYGMLNSPDVLLGSNVEKIVSQALENRGGSAALFRNPTLPFRMAKDVFAEGGEELMNYYRRIADFAKKTPEILSIYSPEEAVKLRENIKKGEVEPFEKIDDLYVSPIADEGKGLKDAILSGYKSRESLDDLYRGAQLQNEIDDLDVPSQTQMEADVSEELPTETIAANTIETQDSVDELSPDLDTQSDLERRIKEGEAQAALDKVDRSKLTKKEKEDRIREDLDDTTFELTQEQREQFFADEDKYIKDLAIADTFGGQKFKDFLGSMGKQLVRTGSFMGIPLGTADFVDSETAKRAAEAEAEIALRKEQIKQTGKDTGPSIRDLKNIKDSSVEFNTAAKDFSGARAAVSLINEVLNLVEQSKKQGAAKLGGFKGKFDILTDGVLAALNIDRLPSAATQVESILDILRNRNIREILGESGRTISNLDRQIVERVFGSFGFMDNPNTVEKKLKSSRDALLNNMESYKENMQSNFDFLQAAGSFGQSRALNHAKAMQDAIDFDPTNTFQDAEKAAEIIKKIQEIDL